MDRRKFVIMHPVGGVLNTEESTTVQFEKVAEVECHSVGQAFQLAQNDFDANYAKLGKRSTSVGDLIVEGEQVFMVTGLGFVDVTSQNPLHL